MAGNKNKQSSKDGEFEGPDGERLRMIMSAFLDHLVAARKERGLQQQEVARRAGLPQGQLSNIETGKRGLTVPTFVKLARGLGMRPADLAIYLGSLPQDLADRSEVVAVVTDGSIGRDYIDNALGKLVPSKARGSNERGQFHDPRAKVSRTKKHNVR